MTHLFLLKDVRFAMRRQASSCSCLPLQLLGARVIGNAKLEYGVVITTNPSLVGSLYTITWRTCGDCEFNVHSATTTVTTSSEVAELVGPYFLVRTVLGRGHHLNTNPTKILRNYELFGLRCIFHYL